MRREGGTHLANLALAFEGRDLVLLPPFDRGRVGPDGPEVEQAKHSDSEEGRDAERVVQDEHDDLDGFWLRLE